MQANDGVAIVACKQLLEAASGHYDQDKVVSVACLGRAMARCLVSFPTVASAC